MDRGTPSRETDGVVVRPAPPRTVGQERLAPAVEQIRQVLEQMENVRKAS